MQSSAIIPENEDFCHSCGDGGELICCDFCVCSYHGVCLDLDTDQLSDPWPCPQCVSSQGKAELAHCKEESLLSTRRRDIYDMSGHRPNENGRYKCTHDGDILSSDKVLQGNAVRTFSSEFSKDERNDVPLASTVSDPRLDTDGWPDENTTWKNAVPPSRSQRRILAPRQKRQAEMLPGEASVLPSVQILGVDRRHFSEPESSCMSTESCPRQSRDPLAREPDAIRRSTSKQASIRSPGLGSTSLSTTKRDFPDGPSEQSTAPGSLKSSRFRAFNHSDTDRVIIPPNVNENEEVDLRRWARVAHETEMRAPHPVLKYWLHPIRYATVHTIADHQTESLSGGLACDAVDLSWDKFSSLAFNGHIFSTPLLIREAFADADDYSPCAYADALEQTFVDTRINVRYHQSEPELLTPPEAACLIRMPPDIVLPNAPNFLDLGSLSNAIKPGLTRISRFRLLEHLVRGARAEYSRLSGKQTLSTPFDISDCQSFDILGLRGAFSGAHVDAMGGTWLRNLFGTKLWMFVPQDIMTEQDWTAFSKDGPDWDPGSKARTLVLRPGDVFFMPPGIRIIHAVLTLENSLMCGGMLWDDFTLVPLLQTIHWIGKNQRTTNEALPYQLGEILNQLERVLAKKPNSLRSEDRGKIGQMIQDLRRLGCECVSCDVTCPCSEAYRRCTPLCVSHSMRDLTECMEEPLVEESDETGSVFRDV